MRPAASAIALGVALAFALSCGREQRRGADIVFRGGPVYTVDSTRPSATAVAVTGTRIVYVGDAAGVDTLVGTGTRVIELRGRMLLPAFRDSHLHPVTAGVRLGECALDALTTPAQVADSIAKCARARPGDAWFLGHGWQLPVFPHANPGRALLDSLVPDRPAYVRAADGHSAWVNSRALALAHITAHTSDPRNGRIERDVAGNPSGTLREDAADLVSALLPAVSAEQRVQGLERAVRLANSLGIVGLQEASADSDILVAYHTLDQRGTLNARVVASIYVDPLAGVAQIPRMVRLRSQFDGKRLRVRGAKIFADGVLESHTAALLEPYTDTHTRGPANLSAGAFDTLVTALDKVGFQIHVHAIGDRAVHMALDAIEAAQRANGAHDARDHIAHLEMIDTLDLPRFRELGVFANFQPLWAFRDSYIKDLTEPIIGPERSSRLYPLGSVAAAGGTIVAGSDWGVSSLNPLEAMEVGAMRCDPAAPTCTTWLPKEKISLNRLIAAYTIQGARLAFEERTTGSITPGKAADLVVLDRDLFAIPPDQIAHAHVLLTLLDGHDVYRDASLH
ncbi:MAG TPA: amidohydrolase [Gemmatimonadaceae bacterium]|nr:amidohydrolase [Gemmatimonadaceae bacterium]